MPAGGYVEKVLVPAGVKTANGASTPITGTGGVRCLLIDVTVTGSPSGTWYVGLEDSIDAGLTWSMIPAHTGAVGEPGYKIPAVAGTYRVPIPEDQPRLVGDQIRCRWIVYGNTPSADFSVRIAAG